MRFAIKRHPVSGLIGTLRPTAARALFAGLTIFACLALAQQAVAQQADVFAVSGLAVDATAASEVDAKEKAVAAGSVEALRLVMQRLTLEQDWSRLPDVGADRINNYIRDISFANEKIGGGRYLADVTYRFVPGAVRNLLTSASVPYTETDSRPMVVVPVLQTADGALLWDEGNVWLNGWAEADLPPGLLPIVVPLGDLSDVAAIGVRQALGGEPEALGRIASKYRAGGVFVAVARPSQASGGGESLDVRVTAYGPGWDGTTFSDTFTSGAAATGAGDEQAARVAFHTRAAESISRALLAQWKEANLIRFGEGTQSLQVSIPVSGLRDWLNIRSRLAQVSTVRDTVIGRLSTTEAEVDIRYIGDLARLQLALSQQKLSLAQDPLDGRWRLTQTP